MGRWLEWLAPLLIFSLQITVPVSHAQELAEAENSISLDASPRPSLAAQSRIPPSQQQDPLKQDSDGTTTGNDQVEKALSLLRRHDRLHPRQSRRPSGIVATAGQYLLGALPSFSIQGPAKETPAGRKKVLPGQLGQALGLLEEAARINNTDAIYLLAQMNFYGNFSYPKDYPEAFKRYQQLALLNGNSSAQHMIGFMYSTGIGNAVERDQAKALLYHGFAARGGDSRSEMTVAFRHHSGIGTTRNCEVAVKHYKNVADKAIAWFRSGPPGGMAWVSESYRLADDDGGVYGKGASFSSAGNNAKADGPNSDVHAALDDVLEYLDLMSRKKDDFKAKFSLGRIHYDGQKYLPRNLKSAKWYFMKVAKLYWHRDGRIIETDEPGLEKYATKAAGYLGKMFLRGEGVEQSFEKAQIWFQRGIKSGDAGSQYGMGLMYLNGLGVSKDIAKAIEYLKASAEQDYPSAQISLGALYLDQGTPNDVQVAGRYFELAARYGHIEAHYYLAEILEQGLGKDRSCGLSAAYYKTVVEKAEPLLSSFAEANQAYEDGDYELALIDFMHAAEQGYEKGQFNVAYLLDQEKSKWPLPTWLTIGTPRSSLLQDAALALIYWTRSAKQTNIDSMVKMGDYYLSGIGTQKDMEKAASCYSAASEYHQSAQALFNLGWMHENGVGIDQDFHLAKRYYDQALDTNVEAYLPVTLSLFKLQLRSAWNTLTHGRVNSIQDEPARKKHWSLSEWIKNFLEDDHPYYRDADSEDSHVSSTDPMPGGDADGMYEDAIDDGLVESFIIMGLAAALVFLIYYRQQHQLAHRQNQAVAGVPEQAAAPGQPGAQDDRGLFPQPGDPAFGQWIAGGVGH